MIMTIEEINNKSKEFANRVNAINMKLRGDYNHDEHYFDDSSYYPANYFIDSLSGKKLPQKDILSEVDTGTFLKSLSMNRATKKSTMP